MLHPVIKTKPWESCLTPSLTYSPTCPPTIIHVISSRRICVFLTLIAVIQALTWEPWHRMSCGVLDCSWPCSPQAWGESGQQTVDLAGILCWPRPGCRAHPTCRSISGPRQVMDWSWPGLLGGGIGSGLPLPLSDMKPPIYLKACGGREAVTCERPGFSSFSRKAFECPATD